MRRILILLLGLFLTAGWTIPANVTPPAPTVDVLLFISPTCDACRQVNTQVLPSLRAKYGAQLDIGILDVSTPVGKPVFQSAITQFNLSSDRQNPPVLVIGNTVLAGADEISARLPALIDSNLKTGGLGWPAVAGLQEALAVDTTNFGGSNNNDALANNLAILMLCIMLAVAALEIYRRPWQSSKKSTLNISWRVWLNRAVPFLVLIGLIISTYLSYVELTASPAVCGPVGNCNAVQHSSYARLFGILPIGVLGVLGNLSILTAWLVKQFARPPLAHYARLALVGLVSFGLLFSIYLTFLEPFVIGATCAWCLGSAVVMTTLFWIGFETSWN